MYSSTAGATGRGRETFMIQSRRTQKQPVERLRLVQLLVCLAMFLAVFVGKGIFPQRLAQVRDEMLTLISADTDFRTAFSQVGESLSGVGELRQSLEEFCVEVFGGSLPEEAPSGYSLPRLTRLIAKESKFFSREPDEKALAEHYFSTPGGTDTALLFQTKEAAESEQTPPETEAGGEEAPSETEEVVPAVGTVLLVSDYCGQPLPEKYTMDHLSLGGLETVTPVLGRVNSKYGYRDHPINGKYQFHGGLDIGGQYGDPILAFAAGTVDYVGEDSSYGLYLQLDHGNGVKSFYAHCRSICVSKGQQVALGEKIGEVGSSGSATGPHLHLELKCGGLRVDPAYYVEALAQ